MSDAWNYTDSAYTVDGDGNRINGNGDLRCPGCPLGDGNAGKTCLHGAHQVLICIPYIQYSDALATYRAENDQAWRTVDDVTPLFPDAYVDGDKEAHDPAYGPGVGDPTYLGPYE